MYFVVYTGKSDDGRTTDNLGYKVVMTVCNRHMQHNSTCTSANLTVKGLNPQYIFNEKTLKTQVYLSCVLVCTSIFQGQRWPHTSPYKLFLYIKQLFHEWATKLYKKFYLVLKNSNNRARWSRNLLYLKIKAYSKKRKPFCGHVMNHTPFEPESRAKQEGT